MVKKFLKTTYAEIKKTTFNKLSFKKNIFNNACIPFSSFLNSLL